MSDAKTQHKWRQRARKSDSFLQGRINKTKKKRKKERKTEEKVGRERGERGERGGGTIPTRTETKIKKRPRELRQKPNGGGLMDNNKPTHHSFTWVSSETWLLLLPLVIRNRSTRRPSALIRLNLTANMPLPDESLQSVMNRTDQFTRDSFQFEAKLSRIWIPIGLRTWWTTIRFNWRAPRCSVNH